MTGLDFKLYLDNAIQATSRTRNSVFFLLTASVVLLIIYFNTSFLDWSDYRFQTLSKSYECIKLNKQSDECINATKYAQKLGLPVEINSDEDKLIYRDFLNTYLRKRTDLNTIQIPIVSAIADINDLGILSSILLISLLMILRANLNREVESLENAKNKISSLENEQSKIEALQLLSGLQVLTSPRPDNDKFRWSILVVVFSPVIIHFLIFWQDYQTIDIGYMLVRNNKNIITFICLLELYALFFIIFLVKLNIDLWLEVAFIFVSPPPKLLGYVGHLKKRRFEKYKKQNQPFQELNLFPNLKLSFNSEKYLTLFSIIPFFGLFTCLFLMILNTYRTIKSFKDIQYENTIYALLFWLLIFHFHIFLWSALIVN